MESVSGTKEHPTVGYEEGMERVERLTIRNSGGTVSQPTNLRWADDTTDTFEPTCRRSDRIPQGHSWGKCDELHCPYYGIKIGPGALFMDGKKLGEVESGRIVMGAG